MTLLLLAGSGEARQLAEGLDQARLPTIASLAGVTDQPRALPVVTRQGGFGGDAGFRDYLLGKDIKAVLDATHPFAAQMSARAARICAELKIPHCQYLRPPWSAEDGDQWQHAAGLEAAVDLLPAGGRALLALGTQAGQAFARRRDCWLALRVAGRGGPERAPWEGGAPGSLVLQANPPFTPAQERALLQELQIDWLVSKNAGGAAGRAKLQAARDLGLKVLMIDRPAQPACHRVDSVAAALDWALRQQVMP